MGYLRKLPNGHLRKLANGHLCRTTQRYHIYPRLGEAVGGARLITTNGTPDGPDWGGPYTWPHLAYAAGEDTVLIVDRMLLQTRFRTSLFEDMNQLQSASLHVRVNQLITGDVAPRATQLYTFHDLPATAAEFWTAGRLVATIPGVAGMLDQYIPVTDADTYWRWNFADEDFSDPGQIMTISLFMEFEDIMWQEAEEE